MSVLLGVIDEPIRVHSTSMFTNKVGGEPDLQDTNTQNIKDIQQISRCSLCGCQLSHITQIYCPLAESPYHRTLNIFACVQRGCWNKSESWKVLRRQRLDRAPSQLNQVTQEEEDSWGVGEDDWGVGQDDWGEAEEVAMVTSQDEVEDDVGYESNDDSTPRENIGGASNDAEAVDDVVEDNLDISEAGASSSSVNKVNDADAAVEQMQQLLIDDHDDGEDGQMQQCVPEDVATPDTAALKELLKPEEMSQPSSEIVVFESYFISVFDEPQRSQQDFRHEQRLLKKYQAQQGFDFEDVEPPSKGKGAGGGDEKYEKTSTKHGDTTFYKFMKKVELQPDQILRYEWNGKAVHINANHQEAVPPCAQCGKPRIFELQLMPSLIPQLKCSSIPGATVEYGTALVYVCQDSCWTDDKLFVEEWIQVEADPDMNYFKL